MKKIMLTAVCSSLLLLSTPLFAQRAEVNKLLEQAKKDAGEMEPKVLKQMLDDEKDVIILDIRETEQRAEGQIYADEMLAITRGNLEFFVMNEIKNKDAVIVTYCRSGGRGVLAAQTLQKLGYKNATNLKGGLKGWAKEGFPIETGLGITKLKTDEE